MRFISSLILILSLSLVHCQVYQGTVYYRGASFVLSDKIDKNGVAYGSFEDTLNTTGFFVHFCIYQQMISKYNRMGSSQNQNKQVSHYKIKFPITHLTSIHKGSTTTVLRHLLLDIWNAP